MPTAPSSAFASLSLDPLLLSALTTLGYEEPTPIQQQSIPPLLEGRDVLAQAATGTGKTAAFALPILHAIAAAPTKGPGPAALILVPTRELAMQLAEAVHRYGKTIGVRVLPVYGGASMEWQLRGLQRGVDVVVATPGRALCPFNRNVYQANPGSPLFGEIKEIVRKTVGLAEPLRRALRPLESKIVAAFVYGSVAKRRDTARSDVDLLVVSDAVSYPELFKVLERVGKESGREISPTIYTREDFALRLKRGNAFLERILEQPKIWVIGGEGDLGA